MKQFKAGYIVDAISNLITDNFKSLNYFNEKESDDINKIKGLLQNLSAFDVEFPEPHKIDYSTIHPVLATINNIITRGLPTKAPLIIEEVFTEIGLTRKNDNEYVLDYSNAVKELSFETVFELLHIIEPNLKFNDENYIGELGSQLERKFLGSHQFIKQLFQTQRDFATINPEMIGGKSVDFSFTSPYLYWNNNQNRTEYKTRIFEIDGPHHLLEEYVHYDTNRDLAASEVNAETFRFTQNEINANAIPYDRLFTEELYKIFEKNFTRNSSDYLEEYSLLFIPFAVARIQKTIIDYFIANKDLLKKETLQIAIIERDLPCGALAIKSLEEIFLNLNALLEVQDKLQIPKIELSIFENEKWVINQKLHCGHIPKNETYFGTNDFHIIIDHSILRRSQLYKEKEYSVSIREAIVIRSSHYYDNSIESSKKIYCANLLHYEELSKKNSDGSYSSIKVYEENINFFIKNIFRKKEFRDGQLPIISRALQQKPVIGLLPTGGGKSLTYQLPVFLQPGLCLVVDPIKSLMEDQVRVLNNNWIDCCDYINSNLKSEEKQSKLIDFKFGQTQFLFVSPERFVMEDFRKIINTIDNTQYKLAFSFCIIDEVHCLSEWGHDFRSTYLMLGKNAQKFVKTRNGKVTLVGLTATASYDVLADIERELDIKHDDAANAVISIDNTIRKELFFDFIECNAKIESHSISDREIKNRIGTIKRDKLNDYVKNSVGKLNTLDNTVISQSLKQHYAEFELDETDKDEEEIITESKLINEIPNNLTFDNTTSIIFCPSTKGILGVTGKVHNGVIKKEVFENLNIHDTKKSYFIGTDESGLLAKEIHSHFVKFLDGKTSYMVCTKAFGMGIDKEDVRAVYHINYSSSPESYIQEAGRAGRDKKKSLCVNLINTEEFYFLNPSYIKQFSKDARVRLRHLIEEPEEILGELKFKKKLFINKQELINELRLIVPNFVDYIDEKKKELNTIQNYNLDESIHDFFHKNSFKGVETELYQLERFFTRKEEITKTVFMQLTEIYNFENDRDIDFYMTPVGHPFEGNIWLKTENKIKFGRIIKTADSTTKPKVDFNHILPDGIIDVPLTTNIFDFTKREWQENSPNTTLYEYLSKPAVNIINNGLSLKDFFESNSNNLNFIVPLDLIKDSLSEILITDFNLIPTPIIHNVQSYLDALQKHSSDFRDYIQRIEETWNLEILNSEIYFNNKKLYKELYYSNINRQDILRIIYRLYSIEFISDYTIDYNKALVTISINKEDKEFYINATNKHLLKYLSKEKTKEKIQDLKKECLKLDVFDTIKKSVKVILEFTYTDIVKKRKRAIEDIREFITESINQNTKSDLKFKNSKYNNHFKQLMYYYFNAKYAKSGHFDIELGIDCSLIDDFENKELNDWEIFEKYTNILNSKASFINECKMMRGSCKRIWRSVADIDTKEDYVLLLLYAYASFGLNNSYYFEEAEKHFLVGFENLYLKTDYLTFENKLNQFLEILSKSVQYEHSKEYIRRIKHKLMLKISTKNTQNLIQELKDI